MGGDLKFSDCKELKDWSRRGKPCRYGQGDEGVKGSHISEFKVAKGKTEGDKRKKKEWKQW